MTRINKPGPLRHFSVLPFLIFLFLASCTKPLAPTPSPASDPASTSAPAKPKITFASISGAAPRYIDSGPEKGFGWMEYEIQEVRKGLKATGFEVEMQWYTPARIAHEFRIRSPLCTWPVKWQDPKTLFSKKPDKIYSIPLNLEGNESHSILFKKEMKPKFEKYLDQKGDIQIEALLRDTSLKTLLIRDFDYGNLGRRVLDRDSRGDQFIKPEYSKSIILLLIKENRQLLEMLNADRFDYIFTDNIENNDFDLTKIRKEGFERASLPSTAVTNAQDPNLVFLSVACGIHPDTIAALPHINQFIRALRGNSWMESKFNYRALIDSKQFGRTEFFHSTIFQFLGQMSSGATEYWYPLQVEKVPNLTLFPKTPPEVLLPKIEKIRKADGWQAMFPDSTSAVIFHPSALPERPRHAIGKIDSVWLKMERSQLWYELSPKVSELLRQRPLQSQKAREFSELAMQGPPEGSLKSLTLFAQGLSVKDLLLLKSWFGALTGLTVLDAGAEESEYLLQLLPKTLEHLRLANCHLGQSSLAKSIQNLQLKTLSLTNSQVSANQLSKILPNLSTSIEELSLSHLRGMLPRQVTDLIQKASWPRLKTLDLNNLGLSDDRMAAFLPHLGKDLRVLRLSHNFISTRYLSKIFLRPLSSLVELDLSFNAVGSTRWNLKMPPGVRSLTLASAQLNPSTLSHIDFPEQLEELDLANNPIGPEGIKRALRHLPARVKFLGLKGTEPSHEGIKLLVGEKSIQEIEELDLSGNALQNEDLTTLARAPFRVARLWLDSNLIGNQGGEAVVSRFLPQLKSLGLSSNRLSEPFSQSLASFMNPNLEELSLASNPGLNLSKLGPKLPATLQVLNLGQNYVGDSEIEDLAPYLPPSLKTLNLSHCAMTSKGIWSLARALPNSLTELNLDACLIHSPGLLALAQALPPSIRILRLGPIQATEEHFGQFGRSLPKIADLLAFKNLTTNSGDLSGLLRGLPDATHLVFRGIKFVKRDGDVLARHLPKNLSELYISGCSLDGSSRNLLRSLPKTLDRLGLVGVPMLTRDFEDLLLNPLPILSRIDFSESGLKSKDAKKLLWAHPLLYHAALSGNPEIEDSFAQDLDPTQHQNLRTIVLNGSGITSRGWILLLQKFSFWALALANNTKFAEEDVETFAKLLPEHLSILDIRGLSIGKKGKQKIRSHLSEIEQQTGRRAIYLE